MNHALLAFGPIGTWELAGILLIALLLFGRRLPDVARSFGKSIVEFKKGMRDIGNEIEDQSRIDAPQTPKLNNKPQADDQAASAKESTPAPESSPSAR